MRCQVNFFKDLVSSEGHSFSTLQYSIEIAAVAKTPAKRIRGTATVKRSG